VLKASLIVPPIVAPSHDRWQVTQPRPYIARAIGVSIYTAHLNHVPGAIALAFVIDIVLRFSSPDTLHRILDSGIFKWNWQEQAWLRQQIVDILSIVAAVERQAVRPGCQRQYRRAGRRNIQEQWDCQEVETRLNGLLLFPNLWGGSA
jgi:hypothetical protein